ncbi:MAG: NAD-dependent epimerase/dehydratase family protein [Planctomycetes bacterium]|nr:NAD-dependent epimerase/dehydratase family protein [Planctomycetota bacterium]
MSGALAWVLGRHGLLGRAVHEALGASGATWSPARPLPWQDPPALADRLAQDAAEFAAACAGRPWRIAWCAGQGVVATDRARMAREVAALDALLSGLARARAGALTGPGALFLASSAGGVYAGAAPPPFDEETPPRAISPYGEAKLAQEAQVRAFAATHGAGACIGRIANLYGPGQDLRKPQGLISQISRALLLREPIRIYVPMDTIRDYVFAPDCGRMVAAALERAATTAVPSVHTKIFASHHGTTVAALLSEFRRIVKRPVRTVQVASPLSAYQARDLRMRSRVWNDLDRLAVTPLVVGIQRTLHAVQEHLARGSA